MKKITLQSVKDEGLGSLTAAAGVIAGSLLMKMASGRINPWIVPAIGLVGGYAARLMGNDTVKDLGTGLLIAGTMDLTKKGLNALGEKVPFAANIAENIPTLSGGMGEMVFEENTFDASSLRGLGMGYQDAVVIDSASLR